MSEEDSRDHVLRDLMRQGNEVAEELIQTNGELRRRLASAEAEIGKLKGAIGRDEAAADLLTRVELLENERQGLDQRARELEQTSRVHEARLHEVEQELNDLASLYVASCQLSATLVPGHVLRHICELLEQLVGIQAFVIYVIEPDGEMAVPVASQGIDRAQVVPQSLSEGELGEVCLSGVPHMREPPAGGKDGEAIATVPLMADEQAVAVISVQELLPHKKTWAAVDSELFRLLSERASSALIAASLYDRRTGPRDALVSLEKELALMDRVRDTSDGGGR